jgi:hypothetical protein
MRQIRRMLLEDRADPFEYGIQPLKVAQICVFPDLTSPLPEKDAAFLPVLFSGAW